MIDYLISLGIYAALALAFGAFCVWRYHRTIGRATCEQANADLAARLAGWCSAHADRVRCCYVGVREAGVRHVHVVGASEAYDFELTELTTRLADEFGAAGWSVHVFQIPNCDQETIEKCVGSGATKVWESS